MEKIRTIIDNFGREEDGVALTEYLILLGIMTAAVIGAVITFGGAIGDAWDGWASWAETCFGDGGPLGEGNLAACQGGGGDSGD